MLLKAAHRPSQVAASEAVGNAYTWMKGGRSQLAAARRVAPAAEGEETMESAVVVCFLQLSR